MAVETNEAYLSNVTASAEDGTSGAWNQAFDSKKSTYEVKFPTGTKKVEIKLDLIEGSTATVNGNPYKDHAVVAMDETGKGKATVTVRKGDDLRTYTIALACQSENTALSGLKVNNSNNPASGDVVDLTGNLMVQMFLICAMISSVRYS